ncbi:hypoxanthine phosphoribosyltransferase [bacterium]|nr:hypoxanthine phosphoribosyltransferase [candidate division CSSED10-310 bacterium]
MNLVKVLSEGEIKRRTEEMGRQLSIDYAGKEPLFIGILRGAFIFLSDLSRAVTIPCSFDFMVVSSYGTETKSTGVVRILKDLNETVEGRHIILVEDIVDTGLTLDYLIRMLRVREPASIKTCALLNKQECRVVEVQTDYVGFDIDNFFVVGYGLDYQQLYRNLPYIGRLEN